MNVKLIAHTSLTPEFINELQKMIDQKINHRTAVALTAIRTCYSPNKPTKILEKEGGRYFGKVASDGEGGTDADRLFRHIFRSKHTSTLEHITYTFAIEGLSRAALAQLTRHRVGFSFSVQSQRYTRFGSDDKTGGFDYVIPDSIRKNIGANSLFHDFMEEIQEKYDTLRELGIPPEDARMVLPNAATTNLVMTANLRAILDFYAKRKPGRGAQWEIAELAERIRAEVVSVDGWTERFFDEV